MSTPIAAPAAPAAAAGGRPSGRIATIDWMRGLVMVLMVIDHASMAFDRHHLSHDSALYAAAATMALPAAEFFTRWITHLCAPTFVFLAGTALALSIEKRVARGMAGWDIDRSILTRGAIIAGLDLTLISLGSGKWGFGVLYAIGVSMMCMAGGEILRPGVRRTAVLRGPVGWGKLPRGGERWPKRPSTRSNGTRQRLEPTCGSTASVSRRRRESCSAPEP